MSEEKELVFIKPKDVPRLLRGSAGRDWDSLFKQIPRGEVLVLNESYGSAPNIRAQVKIYNGIHKNEELKVTQRTPVKIGAKPVVYIERVK